MKLTMFAMLIVAVALLFSCGSESPLDALHPSDSERGSMGTGRSEEGTPQGAQTGWLTNGTRLNSSAYDGSTNYVGFVGKMPDDSGGADNASQVFYIGDDQGNPITEPVLRGTERYDRAIAVDNGMSISGDAFWAQVTSHEYFGAGDADSIFLDIFQYTGDSVVTVWSERLDNNPNNALRFQYVNDVLVVGDMVYLCGFDVHAKVAAVSFDQALVFEYLEPNAQAVAHLSWSHGKIVASGSTRGAVQPDWINQGANDAFAIVLSHDLIRECVYQYGTNLEEREYYAFLKDSLLVFVGMTGTSPQQVHVALLGQNGAVDTVHIRNDALIVADVRDDIIFVLTGYSNDPHGEHPIFVVDGDGFGEIHRGAGINSLDPTNSTLYFLIREDEGQSDRLSKLPANGI